MDGTYTYKTLMVAGMHFQDHYTYQVERVKRCVIHYSAPDGRIYPFCAYNSGPVFREKIEAAYSSQIESFREAKGELVGLPPARREKVTRLPMVQVGGNGTHAATRTHTSPGFRLPVLPGPDELDENEEEGTLESGRRAAEEREPAGVRALETKDGGRD
jgi:hypothetical protein